MLGILFHAYSDWEKPQLFNLGEARWLATHNQPGHWQADPLGGLPVTGC